MTDGTGVRRGAAAEPIAAHGPLTLPRRRRPTHLTVDLVPGRGGGISLQAPEGVRSMVRSRLLTDLDRRYLIGEC
jgi:hypothetical protein